MFENIQKMMSEGPKMPEVSFTKNGYEIRADILGMAKELMEADFHARWQGWEITAQRDEKTGQIVTNVGMPQFPGVEQVLTAAEMLYKFVNSTNSQSKVNR